MSDLNYKYIVFNGTHDYYYYSFYEILTNEYCYFDDDFYDRRNFLSFLRRIHWSSKIQKVINLPLKSFWIILLLKKYKKVLNLKYEDKIIFLMIGANYSLEENGFSKLVRKFFCNAKIIYFFCDLIDKDKYRKLFIENFRDRADIIYSFDNEDAKKYNLKFHNSVYSNIKFLFSNLKNEYDVCFVGQAKDRLEEIIQSYRILTKKGLNCYFYVTGVDSDKQILNDRIIYGKPIDYEVYLEIVARSKCILELMQKGGHGNTLRVNEAITFDKLLLSNNKDLVSNSLYDERYMHVFNELNSLDVSFINIKDVIYTNKEKLLPSEMFKIIEQDLMDV